MALCFLSYKTTNVAAMFSCPSSLFATDFSLGQLKSFKCWFSLQLSIVALTLILAGRIFRHEGFKFTSF